MSDLTDNVAREHVVNYDDFTRVAFCAACEWEADVPEWALPTYTRYHVATVTEAAVRERVARDIEAARDRQLVADRDQRISLRTANHSAQIANRDARIARGGAA